MLLVLAGCKPSEGGRYSKEVPGEDFPHIKKTSSVNIVVPGNLRRIKIKIETRKKNLGNQVAVLLKQRDALVKAAEGLGTLKKYSFSEVPIGEAIYPVPEKSNRAPGNSLMILLDYEMPEDPLKLSSKVIATLKKLGKTDHKLYSFWFIEAETVLTDPEVYRAALIEKIAERVKMFSRLADFKPNISFKYADTPLSVVRINDRELMLLMNYSLMISYDTDKQNYSVKIDLEAEKLQETVE